RSPWRPRSPRSSPACRCRSRAHVAELRMKRRPLTARGWGCLLSGILLIITANAVAARPLLYIGLLLAALPLVALAAVRLPRRRGTVTRQISTDLLTVGQSSQVNVRFDLYAFGIPHG